MGSGDVGAGGEEVGRVRGTAESSPTGPVGEAGLDEGDADEGDGGAGDEGGKDAQHDARGDEGDEDLEQGADGGGTDDGAVAVGAG